MIFLLTITGIGVIAPPALYALTWLIVTLTEK
jgi:hypothetical protein